MVVDNVDPLHTSPVSCRNLKKCQPPVDLSPIIRVGTGKQVSLSVGHQRMYWKLTDVWQKDFGLTSIVPRFQSTKKAVTL
jgi:hypothetical protein